MNIKKTFFLSFFFLGNCLFLFSDDLSNEKALKIQNHFAEAANQPGAVLFTPPTGWKVADPESLPLNVKAMVIGKAKSSFPPSINLGTEEFNGSLKQYLQKVKEINQAHGTEWKDLGKIRTEAGNASLSQVDIPTEWGEVRLMHAILLNKGIVYILTASALKNEFSSFYKDFFSSLRSLKINPELIEMVNNPEREKQLQEACEKMEFTWRSFLKEKKPKEKSDLFFSEEFQDEYWTSFQKKISSEYEDLGKDWLGKFLKKVENDLLCGG